MSQILEILFQTENINIFALHALQNYTDNAYGDVPLIVENE